MYRAKNTPSPMYILKIYEFIIRSEYRCIHLLISRCMENVKVLDLVLILLISAKKIYMISAYNLVIERSCQLLSPLFSQIILTDVKPNLIKSRRL
jgi:hypothetical protein